jgi:hypothetical protein
LAVAGTLTRCALEWQMRQKVGTPSADEQGRERYPALTVRARDALRGIFASHSPAILLDNRQWPAALRDSLATLCASAQQDGYPIEQLLISVKQAWWSLPQQRFALGEFGSEVLALIVSACISEFFRDPAPERAD